MQTAALLDRITTDPRILAGKPVVRGLRISVEQLLKALAAGQTEAELLAEYPELEPADFRNPAFRGRRGTRAAGVPAGGRMKFVVAVGVGRSVEQQLAADGHLVLPVRERDPHLPDD